MIKSNFFEYKYIFLSLFIFISYIKIGEIKMDYEQEKEWIRKIEEERNEMDRNQKVRNAKLEGEAIGKTNALRKNIRSMYKKGFDIEYVEDIIKYNSQHKVNINLVFFTF